MKFEVYIDHGGKWRWRAVASNGRIVACSGESFASMYNAKRAVRNVIEIISNRTCFII